MDELRVLQRQLNEAVDSYACGEADLTDRANVVGKAKDLIRNVSVPSDLCMQHCSNVRLLSGRIMTDLYR